MLEEGTLASTLTEAHKTPRACQDALVEARALMCFPPSSSDPDIYQEWLTWRRSSTLPMVVPSLGLHEVLPSTVQGRLDKTQEP